MGSNRKTSKGNLRINLGVLRENYRSLVSKVGASCEVSAVVKADSYGLGAGVIAEALREEGCRKYFVACLDEAMELRNAYPDIEIMILNGFYTSGADLYAAHNLTPVLGSFLEVDGYRELARTLGRRLPAYLHFNTRMNRLGFSIREGKELVEDMSRLDGLDIKCVMSHLACADEPDHPMNKTQLEVFQESARHFPSMQKALCNSSGIFLGPEYHFDMVRPGMALYGLNPTPGKENPMRSVVSLEVPIIRTRIVYDGAHVGYGATYRFDKDTLLATVAAGYADGLFRSLSNSGALYYKGYKCPIRGRVSMDLTTVDLSGMPEGVRPGPGDFLEVLGDNQSADDLATDAGTVGYEVLTNLGNRYKREYMEQ